MSDDNTIYRASQDINVELGRKHFLIPKGTQLTNVEVKGCWIQIDLPGHNDRVFLFSGEWYSTLPLTFHQKNKVNQRCMKCEHTFIPEEAIIEEAANPLEIDPKTIEQLSALYQKIIAYVEQKEETDGKIRGLREEGYKILDDAGITPDILPKKGGDNQDFADLVYGRWW